MPWVDTEALVRAAPPSTREQREVADYLRRNAKARFYADENFPNIAITELLRMGGDVVTARQMGRQGHPDENHLAEALRLNRILITCDRDYLDERRFPLIHCPAIVVCNFGQCSLAEIQMTYACLSGPFTVPQFYDKWVKIDGKQGTWSEYVRFLDGTTEKTRNRFFQGRHQHWVD